MSSGSAAVTSCVRVSCSLVSEGCFVTVSFTSHIHTFTAVFSSPLPTTRTRPEVGTFLPSEGASSQALAQSASHSRYQLPSRGGTGIRTATHRDNPRLHHFPPPPPRRSRTAFPRPRTYQSSRRSGGAGPGSRP